MIPHNRLGVHVHTSDVMHRCSARRATLPRTAPTVAATPQRSGVSANGQPCPDFNPWTKGPTIAAAPGIDWSGCDLSNFVLSNAKLAGAKLNGANLTNVNLSGADLSNATVSGVIYSGTTCPNGSKSSARNPQSCVGQGGGL